MFGRSADVEDSLPVDVLGDWESDGAEHDIDLGAGRGPGARRRRGLLAGGVVAALVVVGAAVAVSRDSGQPSSGPAMTVATSTPSTSPTTVASGRTASTTPRRATTTTISPLADVAPLLATDRPWSIYLTRQDNQRTIRIDVQSGAVEGLSGVQRSFVLSPTERYVIEPASEDSTYFAGTLPAGPWPGTYWQPGWDPATGTQLLVLVQSDAASGTELATVNLGPNEYLLGSTAGGEAVVSGPDGRAYVTGLDGQRRRLAEGQVRSVENGFFLETACDAGGACLHVFHGASELTMPYGGVDVYATFSPDGTWVAVGRQDVRSGEFSVDLVRLADGEVIPIEDQLVPAWSMLSSVAVGWTPDGRWAVAASRGDLVVVDVVTSEVRRLSLPVETRGSAAVQAIL